MSRIIGTAEDIDGDPVKVIVTSDGLIEVEYLPSPGLNDGAPLYGALTVAEATVLARLLLAAGDVIDG